MGRPKGGNNQHRTCEEKERLIKEYYASGKGYQMFAKEHGIAHSLFSTWLKKYQEQGIAGLQHGSRKAPFVDKREEEILKLKLIIADQQIEIERLKKQKMEEIHG